MASAQVLLGPTPFCRRVTNLYLTEAGGRRKAGENIGDFAGFQSDSKQKKHFVANQISYAALGAAAG
jgi:hypothetical protein